MTTKNVIYWLPRILCLLAICFISLFAADSFAPNLTPLQQLGSLLMHLIPSFILTIFLLIAWKHEKLGGIIFTLLGLAFTPFIYQRNYAMNHSVWISLSIIAMITIPFIIVGVLFLISSHARKNNS